MGLSSHRIGDGYDVRSLAVTYREGHVLRAHTHPWAQLIYAISGLMTVAAGDRIWFVPPTKAVWVPAGVDHEIQFQGEVAMRTLYIDEARARLVPQAVKTLEVAPLLSELIVHVQTIGMLNPETPEHDHLAAVLIDLIAAAPTLDLELPYPRDGRAAGLAGYLWLNPADKCDLSTLAPEFGASLRTMQRYFADETGLSLDRWRQKARLVRSFGLLGSGRSVSATALEVGYESTSAYVAAFKKHFGVTPGKVNASLR